MKLYKRTYKRRVGQEKKLRPKKAIKKYKSTDSYLNEVWRQNKSNIEGKIEKFNDPRSKRQIWKDSIKEYMNEINPETGRKYTLQQAIDKFQRSEAFTSAERRRAEVSFTRIKESSKETWKKIRRAIGWTTRFDPEKVVDSWSEGKLNYYRYKDPVKNTDIVIVESISPKSGSYQVEIFDYGDWNEQRLKSSTDPRSIAEYNIQRQLNFKRQYEINRIRRIMQGENFIGY